MTERISLVEAYDNRDVIAQLVRLRDNVDELLNILKDIDPNGDLTNVVTKTGDQTIDGVKTFIGQIVADCDIIQNGAAYETHAEQVFSVNDYIVTRDGQITGLTPGDLSGFHVKKYNGVDDSRLGVDSTGMMRVGDVGQEQPLATRDEVADMTSGALVKWDGVNQKLIAPDSNIGDDDHPVKISAGIAVPISNSLEYLPGDSVAIAANQIYGSGYLNFNNVAQVLVPLSKPISSSVTTITFSDLGTVRCNGSSSTLTLSAVYAVPGGIQFAAATTLTAPEHACAVRGGSSGTIITFS